MDWGGTEKYSKHGEIQLILEPVEIVTHRTSESSFMMDENCIKSESNIKKNTTFSLQTHMLVSIRKERKLLPDTQEFFEYFSTRQIVFKNENLPIPYLCLFA